VPSDVDRKRLDQTTVSTAWLHQEIRKSAAETQLLLLDACHAGGAMQSDEGLAKGLAIEATGGVAVLASCRSREKSWEWTARKQGIFTYWLCRGLEGGADEDGDGAVSLDEINRYCATRVTATVKDLFGEKKTQTPVRLIGEEVAGDPRLLVLLPELPETLCRRLAEHLDLDIRRNKFPRAGVLEFVVPVGKSEGLASATLPKYTAELIRRALHELAKEEPRYVVLSDEQIQAASRQVLAADIGNPTRMAALAARAEVVVTGTIKQRGRNLHLQCELIATNSGEKLANPSGSMPLSESLASDWGASFDNTRNQPTVAVSEGVAYKPELVDVVLKRANEGNPALAADFPFAIEIWKIEAGPKDIITPKTGRTKKDFVTLPANATTMNAPLLISVKENELFEIRMWNRSNEKIGVVIQVDGLNSLGQERERTERARMWILDPKPANQLPEANVVEGWYLPRNAAGDRVELRRFVFTDVSKSVAGRQNFSESLGLITATIFRDDAGRGLAVGEAQVEPRTLKPVDFRRGRVLGSIQIRYAR
jgi:hypothetical protein